MIRQSVYAAIAALFIATPTSAAIILSLTSVTDLGQGLYGSYLHAHSTDVANQRINGVGTPLLNDGGFGGSLPHQVWLGAGGVLPSPTVVEHTPGLWNSAYTPLDSFWLFDATNSISIGAAFIEANNGTNGATGLPIGVLGVPYTGFGAMGTNGGAMGARAFINASGKPGADVDFAHVVLKGPGPLYFSGTILTAQGNNATFVSFPLFIPEPSSLVLVTLALAGRLGGFRRR